MEIHKGHYAEKYRKYHMQNQLHNNRMSFVSYQLPRDAMLAR